jgi:transposase
MNAYSKDLRVKVLDAVGRGVPRREVAELLGISLSTISRYVKLKASGRRIAPMPSPGRKAKILASPDHRGALWRQLEKTTPPPWKSTARCSRGSGGFLCPWRR